MVKPIHIRSSNSPLGGGSVRVYVGDKLVWTKRVKDLNTLLRAENDVNYLVRSLETNKSYRKLVLRLI